MKFLSTRKSSPPVTFSEAISQGLAPDGGLYVPENIPQQDWRNYLGIREYSEFACDLLEPFFEGDSLRKELPQICRAAFSFPVVLKSLPHQTALLELFHGPTCAFKDFGARFLAECFTRMDSTELTVRKGSTQRTILVATSGDTGGAVAAAFHKKPGVRVGVLFPKGQVSNRQEKQLTCWGENIHSFSVRGDFDACQALVKSAFADDEWRREHNLTSANSINLGRLLPQIVYYAYASVRYQNEFKASPSFIIPAGNLGNAVGAFYAREMGFPIAKIALASNANRTISDFFNQGVWHPRPSVSTLANAMDVGAPSNVERLFSLYKISNANQKDNGRITDGSSTIRSAASAISVSDDQIRDVIKRGEKDWGEIWCPHTATAVYCREQFLREPHWIIVSTAHPAKFENVVEPLIGHTVAVPEALSRLLELPSHVQEIDPDLDALLAHLKI